MGPPAELAFGLLIAVLGSPVLGAAGVPDWDSGDVEAANRYRALERERALRFRAAAEDRVAEPRRGERPRQRELRAERPRDDRASRVETRGRVPARRSATQRVFEPWVSRLGQAIEDALRRAFVQAAHDAWLALREAIQAWLEDTWREARADWTDADLAAAGVAPCAAPWVDRSSPRSRSSRPARSFRARRSWKGSVRRRSGSSRARSCSRQVCGRVPATWQPTYGGWGTGRPPARASAPASFVDPASASRSAGGPSGSPMATSRAASSA